MNRVEHRIKNWESLFEKYKNADSEYDFVFEDDRWEPAVAVDQELPEGLREIIDDHWDNERSQTFNSRKNTNGDLDSKQHISKAFDMSVLEEIKSNLLKKFSSPDTSLHGSDNDDYESCESDNNLEDPITVSKKEFLAAFCQRSQNIKQKRKKLSSDFQQLRAKQENNCLSVSLPLKQFEKHSSRPKDLSRSDSAGRSSTLPLPSPSKRCSIASPEKSTLEKHSRLFGLDRSHSDGNSSKIAPSSAKTTRVLSSKQPLSRNDSVSIFERSRFDANLSSSSVMLSEKSMTSKESSFSNYLNRLKIGSPPVRSKPIQGEAGKPREINISSKSCGNLKDESDKLMTPPCTSPADEKKKQSFFASPRENRHQSPEILWKDCEVVLTRLNEFVIENRKSEAEEVPASIIRTSQRDNMWSISRVETSATVDSSKDGDIKMSCSPSPSRLRRIITLGSTNLKKRLSQRKSIRSVTKGRSILTI